MGKLQKYIDRIGRARFIMLLFLSFLVIMMIVFKLNTATILSNMLTHISMNAFFVLAMMVTIRTGTGLNFGLPLGLIAGMLAGVLSLEWELGGWTGILAAFGMAIVFASVVGWLYGLIINKVKGSEMVVGNYIAYSFTFLMCIAWMFLPFRNSKLILVVNGYGLRTQVPILDYYYGILDNFLSVKVFGITVPLGLLLIFAVVAFGVWLFFRTRTGIGTIMAGTNPKFAKGLGISEDRAHIIGTMISSVLAAIGIIVYSQSYGYYMLYTTPKSMAFPPMAAILIGGAAAKKASLSNVIIGLVVYYAIITLASPVASAIFVGDSISEPLRVVIQNGGVLYALTRIGGGE